MSYRGQGQNRGGPPRGGGPSRGRVGPPGRGGYGSSYGSRGGAPTGPIIFKESIPARVPDRLSDPKLSSLISSFNSLRVSGNKVFSTSTQGPERPLRPGFGTLGTNITLRANFFALRISKNIPYYYDYAVSITGPKSEKDGIKIRIFELLERHPSFRAYENHIAHDKSQRLVSAKLLPQPLSIKIAYFDEHQPGPSTDANHYTVEIKLVQTLATADLIE